MELEHEAERAHARRRQLALVERPHERGQLAPPDDEIDAVERARPHDVAVLLDDPLDHDAGLTRDEEERARARRQPRQRLIERRDLPISSDPHPPSLLRQRGGPSSRWARFSKRVKRPSKWVSTVPMEPWRFLPRMISAMCGVSESLL